MDGSPPKSPFFRFLARKLAFYQAEKIAKIRDQIPKVKKFILLDNNSKGLDWLMTWDMFLKQGKRITNDAFQIRTEAVEPEDIASIVYTSGTTGAPKGVMISHQNSGLLLLTNDGRLHHRLSHPSFDHEKEYEVTVQQPITDAALHQLSQGVDLKGVKTRPAEVDRISGRRFRIVLKEGRNRQIRRMVSMMGHKVVRLKRIRMANVRLGRLPIGAWRHLTAAEKKNLLRFLER